MVLEIEDGWLAFSLVDDGIGPPNAPTAGQGLRNMSAPNASMYRSRVANARLTMARSAPRMMPYGPGCNRRSTVILDAWQPSRAAIPGAEKAAL